ncbi:MAG: hypothetical protein ACLQU1_36970 [Bryobacteraceae bacterium]
MGDLRWRAPEAAAKWDGVKHADKFAPECKAGKRPRRCNERGLPLPQRMDACEICE